MTRSRDALPLLLVLLTASCDTAVKATETPGGSADACQEATMHSDLEWIQRQIFSGCASTGCHGGEFAAARLRLDVDRPRLIGVPSRSSPAHSLVVPGRPDESYLLIAIGGAEGPLPALGRMPPGAPLCQEKIDAVRRWIAGLEPTAPVDPEMPPTPVDACADAPAVPTTGWIETEVFAASGCTDCHNTARPTGGLDLTPGHAEQGLRSVTANAEDGGLRVAPGRSGDSYLVALLLGQGRPPLPAMPPRGERLCQGKIDAVRRWIDAMEPLPGPGPGPDPGQPPDPGADPCTEPPLAPSAAWIQREVFAADDACTPCHAGEQPVAGLDLGSELAAVQGLVAVPTIAPDAGLRVVPGQPAESYLVKLLEGRGATSAPIMPPFGDPLCEGKIEAVRRWIRNLAQ